MSRLKQWPCQIKLLPAESDLYDGEDILLAADCTAMLALENSGKGLPFRVVVLSHDGRILSDEQA